MKKYFIYLVLFGLMYPLLASGQVNEKIYSFRSVKPSGEWDVNLSYYILHDTLFSSRLNDNKKIALADIDFSSRKIEATNSRVDKTNETVYAVEIKPLAGKTAYKSLGEYAYTYGSDSFDIPTADRMYVWIGGAEAAGRTFDRFKSLASGGKPAAAVETGGNLTSIKSSNPFGNPFSSDFGSSSGKTEEKKAETTGNKEDASGTKTSNLFSNDFLNNIGKQEEKKGGTPSASPVDMNPLADIFGDGEVDNSKKTGTTSQAAPVSTSMPDPAPTRNNTAYTGSPALSPERLEAAKTEIQNTVNHVKDIVGTMNIIVRTASKSNYKLKEQDFRETKEQALRALNSVRVRYKGKVNDQYISGLNSLADKIEAYEFPAHHLLPR